MGAQDSRAKLKRQGRPPGPKVWKGVTPPIPKQLNNLKISTRLEGTQYQVRIKSSSLWHPPVALFFSVLTSTHSEWARHF